MSAESGVPTFRATDGLWQKFRSEELANMDAFMKNPKMVWEWYQWRRELIASVEPNPGHFALAEWEEVLRAKNATFDLITQNVDNLHRLAGSDAITELHGNIMRSFCMDCSEDVDEDALEDAMADDKLPHCKCGGMLRPGVVWFGEMLPEAAIEHAFHAAGNCDFFLCVGSSNVVYPAASLPQVAQDSGAYCVEINPEVTDLTGLFDESLREKAGVALPNLISSSGT